MTMSANNPDSDIIRFTQRLHNFRNVMARLEEALDITSPSDTERAGIIQFYEMAFELAWKGLKDYLQWQGLDPKSPRDTIKTGIRMDVLTDGDSWMQALTDRNLTVHTYDEEAAMAVEQSIRTTYYPLLKDLAGFFEKQAEDLEQARGRQRPSGGDRNDNDRQTGGTHPGPSKKQ